MGRQVHLLAQVCRQGAGWPGENLFQEEEKKIIENTTCLVTCVAPAPQDGMAGFHNPSLTRCPPPRPTSPISAQSQLVPPANSAHTPLSRHPPPRTHVHVPCPFLPSPANDTALPPDHHGTHALNALNPHCRDPHQLGALSAPRPPSISVSPLPGYLALSPVLVFGRVNHNPPPRAARTTHVRTPTEPYV